MGQSLGRSQRNRMYERHKHNLNACEQYIKSKVGYIYLFLTKNFSDGYYDTQEFPEYQYEEEDGLVTRLEKSIHGDFNTVTVSPCNGKEMLEKGFMQEDGYEPYNLQAVFEFVGYMLHYNGFYVRYYKGNKLVHTDFFNLGIDDIQLSHLEEYDAIEINVVYRDDDESSSSMEDKGVDEVWMSTEKLQYPGWSHPTWR